jgi:hypothetical protein
MTTAEEISRDIWLYEEDAVREMLTGVGFVDIRLDGFGVLAPS